MRLSFLLFLLLPVSLFSQTNQGGVNLQDIDTTTNPCTDFYQYACGNWINNTEIPRDENSYSSFSVIRERNEKVLHEILVELDNKKNRTPEEQKLGDFYHSCMNVSSEDSLDTLLVYLKDIDQIHTFAQLTEEVAKLHVRGIGALFSFGAGVDPDDSTHHIADLEQSGLTLPDIDFYKNPQYAPLIKLYLQYMRGTLTYVGFSKDQAKTMSHQILTVENSLAKIMVNSEDRRNPKEEIHKMTIDDLYDMNSSIYWLLYFERIHAPKFNTLNVSFPQVFVKLDSLMKTIPMEYWKTYLKWQVVSGMGPLLSDTLEHKSFDFFGRTLSGLEEEEPRWKQCVGATNGTLTDLLGREYVNRQFSESSKKQISEFVRQIKAEMEYNITTNTWMSQKTKEQAIVKLQKITDKIGYPDSYLSGRYKHYGELFIDRDNFINNVIASTMEEFKDDIGQINQPVDRTAWSMAPPTVNAYYSPMTNSINFPAGILQPPLFDPNIDMAYNYGSMVAIIGHELTHGFDDEGRRFDSDGNLKDWWTQEDEAAFNKQAQGLIDQYSKYVALEDKKNPKMSLRINGKLTLGENIADNGGLRLAFMAFLENYKSHLKTAQFNAKQRFFLGWAQSWCSVQTSEFIRNLTLADPHALPKFRVNGTVSNMEQFGEAFSCQAGTPMNPVNKNRVW